MSLADKLHNQFDPAFTRGLDVESARRQLRVSIILVAAMGIAAFVLAFMSSNGTQFSAKQLIFANDPTFSGRLVSIGDVRDYA